VWTWRCALLAKALGCLNIIIFIHIYFPRLSKSDSAPVRGDGYEPASLWIQQSQHGDVAQRVVVVERCGR